MAFAPFNRHRCRYDRAVRPLTQTRFRVQKSAATSGLHFKLIGSTNVTLKGSRATVRAWAKSDKELAAFQISNALIKAQHIAVADAQYDTIKPIVEFYEIDWAEFRDETWYEILPRSKECSLIQRGVREELQRRSGLYIFYDSRGRALYVGKARRQTLWKEMNLTYNRARGEVQTIKLVSHPEREQEFSPAYERPRQPRDTLKLHELADYFSAYWVLDGMIDDLEALLVRGFANDLLNIRMEKFDHFG